MLFSSIFSVAGFTLGIYFLLCAFIPDIFISHIKMTPGYLVSAASSVFAASAIVYTAYCFKANIRRQESGEYLKKIEQYLYDATQLISIKYDKNNWEHGIRLLRSAISISQNITIDIHKTIFVSEIENTAYKIRQTLSHSNYVELHPGFSKENCTVINENTLMNNKTAISITDLSFFFRFLIKTHSVKSLSTFKKFKRLSSNIPLKILNDKEIKSYITKNTYQALPQELQTLAQLVQYISLSKQ